MDGMIAALFITGIIIPSIFLPIIREHNRKMDSGLIHTFDCNKCRYQGNHKDELDNHQRLTLHGVEQ